MAVSAKVRRNISKALSLYHLMVSFPVSLKLLYTLESEQFIGLLSPPAFVKPTKSNEILSVTNLVSFIISDS